MRPEIAIRIIINKISKKPSCLSIWYSGWYVSYYAFNGNSKQEKKWDKDGCVPKMYKKSQQVYYDDSYIRFKPIYNYHGVEREPLDFSLILSRVGQYDLNTEFKPNDPAYSDPLYRRNWTCAERKILGYVKIKYKNIKPTIYTSKYPCDLCLPELSKFVFVRGEDCSIIRGKVIKTSKYVTVIHKK